MGRNRLSGRYNIKTDLREVVRKGLSWTELIVISGGCLLWVRLCAFRFLYGRKCVVLLRNFVSCSANILLLAVSFRDLLKTVTLAPQKWVPSNANVPFSLSVNSKGTFGPSANEIDGKAILITTSCFFWLHSVSKTKMVHKMNPFWRRRAPKGAYDTAP